MERKKDRLGTNGCGHPCARQAASASFTCCGVLWGWGWLWWMGEWVVMVG